MQTDYEIRQCTRPDCGLRFPVRAGTHKAGWCPRCGAPTAIAGRPLETGQAAAITLQPPGPQVEAVLDNLRSALNVGAIFRTADGCGLRRLHLCGITPTPDHPRVAKTALGAEDSVAWSQHNDARAAVAALRAAGIPVWALEGGPHSQSLFAALAGPLPPAVALVLGSEVTGVDPELLALCDRAVSIPMAGVKGSLNVAVAFSIAAYALRYGLAASGAGALNDVEAP